MLDLGFGVRLDKRERKGWWVGRTEEIKGKAGEARLYPAGQHLPENLSDRALELILVELKASQLLRKLYCAR